MARGLFCLLPQIVFSSPSTNFKIVWFSGFHLLPSLLHLLSEERGNAHLLSQTILLWSCCQSWYKDNIDAGSSKLGKNENSLPQMGEIEDTWSSKKLYKDCSVLGYVIRKRLCVTGMWKYTSLCFSGEWDFCVWSATPHSYRFAAQGSRHCSTHCLPKRGFALGLFRQPEQQSFHPQHKSRAW